MPVNVKATNEYIFIDTGIHLEDGDLQPDEVMILFPKSGIGTRTGFYFSNTLGVIDSDYRGSIKCYFNTEMGILDLNRGDAFMQGIIFKFSLLPGDKPVLEERTGGFGSTAEPIAEKKRGRKPKVTEDE
jgi:dUTP pyrophosphatase